MQRQQIRSSNLVGWADTVNNNATFTDAWQKTEYGEFLIEDLDLAYANGQCVIESIMISGAAGQQPVAADKELIEILISDSSTFGQTNLLAVAKGFYSDALIDTNKRLACFQIRQPIAIPSNGRIYFTVKCASSDALTADQATIVASQS
jgi:hypothetical protein|tara:strand:- start:1508 stop:1954 length:447 start_codon:yes stop_codon:yes gene_type:complete